MTSSVVITACCATTKHVEVRIMLDHEFGDPEQVDIEYLENGQSKTVYIYDNRYVVTQELEKAQP